MTGRTSLPMFVAGALLLLALAAARPAVAAESPKLEEVLEGLILKSSPLEPMEGFASYYAKRFEGRRTTSGHRYHPDKLTAAHESLPLGTVVRVVNPATNQEVHVTITDRCARKAFNFIDLSRAAAKKIGLWGKGKIRVVIIPLLQEKLEKPT
jgi:peptidoglycan lytic transglycosylase